MKTYKKVISSQDSFHSSTPGLEREYFFVSNSFKYFCGFRPIQTDLLSFFFGRKSNWSQSYPEKNALTEPNETGNELTCSSVYSKREPLLLFKFLFSGESKKGFLLSPERLSGIVVCLNRDWTLIRLNPLLGNYVNGVKCEIDWIFLTRQIDPTRFSEQIRQIPMPVICALLNYVFSSCAFLNFVFALVFPARGVRGLSNQYFSEFQQALGLEKLARSWVEPLQPDCR